MPKTYTKIATTTLGSATSSVVFSSVTSSYTDIVISINGQLSANNGNPVRIRFNSDSGSNYAQINLYHTSSAAASDKPSGSYIEVYGLPTSPGWASQTWNLFDYANTNTFKSLLAQGNNASQQSIITIGTWSNTSAISNIELYSTASNFEIGSTFTLYGILKA